MRQFNAWMSRGFNAVYVYFSLAAIGTFFVLALGIPGGWNRWFIVEIFTIFGILSLLRELRARRRRWAVRLANGNVVPLFSERKARELAGEASWGHPVVLHRAAADADWVEQP